MASAVNNGAGPDGPAGSEAVPAATAQQVQAQETLQLCSFRYRHVLDR